MFLDYAILVLYTLCMVGIAVYTHKRAGTVDEFLLAGKRGINGWMSAFSYGTTYFSAVIFIGYAGKFGAQYGLASVWIGVSNALFGGLVAWTILAKRTKNMTARLASKTMPDFFMKRYDKPWLKLLSAIIIFLFLIPYSASVYNGLGSLFGIVFGIDGWIVMIALALITAIYLFFGGYFATALSDFIQGIIMLAGIAIMVICFMSSDNVGWDISKLTSNPELNWFTFDSSDKGIYGSTVSLLSLMILTSFGVMGLPQTIHKYYAVRDKKAIKQGTIVSTIFAFIIGFGAYFVGALSPLFQETAAMQSDHIIPYMLSKVIPAGLMGIIAALVLSASMSTLASVSLASASVVAVDIYKGSVDKNASDKRVNIVMKSLCVIFILISVVIAIANDKFGITAIAYMMGLSWGTLSGCFIGPFVLGLFSRKVTATAAATSMIGSLILTVGLVFFFGYHKNGFDASFGKALASGVESSPMIGVICMAFSLLVTVLVSSFTKKPSEEVLVNAFEKEIENEII